MDAETKRWLAHFDEKLDTALARQATLSERTVRLEEARLGHDREHKAHREATAANGEVVRQVEVDILRLTAIQGRVRARLAGFSAGVAAAVSSIIWALSHLGLFG